MRGQEFYQQDITRNRKPSTTALPATPWNSAPWIELIKEYATRPFCIDIQTEYHAEEMSVRRKIEALRNFHLHKQLPKSIKIPFGIDAQEIVHYTNPKPFEKVCIRASIFASNLPTEIPGTYTLVVFLFSADNHRPIAHYVESIDCAAAHC